MAWRQCAEELMTSVQIGQVVEEERMEEVIIFAQCMVCLLFSPVKQTNKQPYKNRLKGHKEIQQPTKEKDLGYVHLY